MEEKEVRIKNGVKKRKGRQGGKEELEDGNR